MKRQVKIKSIITENGKLFYTIENSRQLLASCTPKIDVYEEQMDLPLLNADPVVRKRKYHLAICGDIEPVRMIDEAFLRKITAFDLSTEIQLPNGNFERTVFNNLYPIQIDLSDNEWIFEITNVPDILKKLSLIPII